MFGSKINPSGAAADLGDEIANSLRLNDNDNAYVTKTYGSGSDQTTMWCSVWFKRGNLSTTQGLMGAYQNGSNLVMVYLNASDVLLVQGETGGVFSTSMTTVAKLRDTTGWYHLYWQINTTTGDSSIWLNGVEQELAGGSSKDSTSDTYVFGGAHQHLIGTIRNTAGTYFPFDGYIAMAQFGFGATQAATDFGRYSTTHTNTWVPIDASGVTYGANGVLLDFTVAPGTGNGAGTDTSGNANHFTDTNLAADDQSSDTPTNVFATASPINKGTESVTFSEGNTKLVGVGNNSSNSSVAGTIAMTAGKYYWEQKFTGAQTSGVQALGCGIFNADNERVDQVSYATSTNKLTFYTDNNNIEDLSGTGTDYVGSITDQTSATVGFAVDFDNGWAWVHVNGTYINGVPTFTDGTNAIQSSIPSGTWLPFWFQNGGTTSKTWEINFGTTPVGAGGNADDNGYGDFDYAPPSGFLALCQANLPNVVTDLGGVDKPFERIAIVTDTEANIEATLAAAENWTDYIRWFKNITNVESHMVVFSDDSSNELSFDDAAAAKAAKRSLSGTDTWLGVSWRTGANYGCVTGTISHTNGAATTVTHSLSSSDVLIVLRRTDAGSQWFTYHPKLTSGDLVYLDALTGETLDAAITNLTSDAFDIDAGEPTGTFRYIVWRADPGYLDLGTHTGNAATDGVFITGTGNGALVILKDQNNTSAAGSWNTWLNVFDNANGNSVWLNTTNAALGNLGDTLSTGFKARSSNSGMNGAHAYINIMWHTSAIGGGIPFPNAR